jgi:hypothetical protein
MSSEFSFDSEQMEKWMSTAKLRRREVERIEAFLSDEAERLSLPNFACNAAVEMKDQLVKAGEQVLGSHVKTIHRDRPENYM